MVEYDTSFKKDKVYMDGKLSSQKGEMCLRHPFKNPTLKLCLLQLKSKGFLKYPVRLADFCYIWLPVTLASFASSELVFYDITPSQKYCQACSG